MRRVVPHERRIKEKEKRERTYRFCFLESLCKKFYENPSFYSLFHLGYVHQTHEIPFRSSQIIRNFSDVGLQ
jgi:hypothetical protein